MDQLLRPLSLLCCPAQVAGSSSADLCSRKRKIPTTDYSRWPRGSERCRRMALLSGQTEAGRTLVSKKPSLHSKPVRPCLSAAVPLPSLLHSLTGVAEELFTALRAGAQLPC